MTRPDPAALLRGASTALLTAALAAAAHTLADGGAPSGPGVALLVALAGTVGTITATAELARGALGLMAVLGTGQGLGHLALAVTGHSHRTLGAPTPAMVSAHAAAVVVGAVLIAAGGRLCRALSTAVRALSPPSSRPSRPAAVGATTSDQPMQSMLLLRSSLSHRGPPVGAYR